jgi:hypothetical protein
MSTICFLDEFHAVLLAMRVPTACWAKFCDSTLVHSRRECGGMAAGSVPHQAAAM